MDSLTITRLPVVGVMGSGTGHGGSRARVVGRMIAEMGVHLLTGGGQGTMACVCRAFCEVNKRFGKSIGILPGNNSGRPPAGYPNPWVEIVIQTHLPFSGEMGMDALSRNHINILSSDAVVILEGGAGTLSEVNLAMVYNKPVVAFVDDGSFSNLPTEIKRISEPEALQTFLRDKLKL